MMLLLPLMVPGAYAGAPDPLTTGQDLVAWRALQEQTDPGAWRGFILAFPDSPLAELAWRRLVEVGHAPDPTSNPALARIATSYAQHQADLARTPEGYAVATLRLNEAQPADADDRGTRRAGLGLRTPIVLTSAPSARATGWLVVDDPLLQTGEHAVESTDQHR